MAELATAICTKCLVEKPRAAFNKRTRGGIRADCKECYNGYIRSRQTKRAHADALYVITCGPYLKIGRTTNISNRLGKFRTGNPFPIDLVICIEGCGYMEKAVHEQFASSRHNLEWFRGTHEICEWLAALVDANRHDLGHHLLLLGDSLDDQVGKL